MSIIQHIDIGGESTKYAIQMQIVDERGYPHNPLKIRMPIKRENLPPLRKMKKKETLWIPVTHDGKKETIIARIVETSSFDDGISIILDTVDGFLKNWFRLILWIPKEGHCGII